MAISLDAHGLLEQEARALLTRLARVRPFALHETMVLAAAPPRQAQAAIEGYLAAGRRELRARVLAYLTWLRGDGRRATSQQAQRRFVFLRLRFNVVLSQFDVFADVLTQRSEHGTGVWLGGLDIVAADALRLQGDYYESPPVVCYLDRGHGAAIRRARTRLPGGGQSPVAIIRVPRERMVGTGIASSLVHEVGHQGVALLDLNDSLRPVIQRRQQKGGADAAAWRLWERWISEITADLWSVARIGVGSTMGLIGVVSLPRAFVFRVNLDDPHPIPWVRVRLSCAMGAALYPDPQWEELSRMWASFYPVDDELPSEQRDLIAGVERTMPEFVQLVLTHRPASLRGSSVGDALRSRDRTPNQLRALMRAWGGSFLRMRAAKPALVFAVFGQARADGALSPEEESRNLADLLTYWALRETLNTTQFAGTRSRDSRVLSAVTD